MKLVLVFVTLITVVFSVQAQCTQKLSDLPPVPEFFGFHLGMTKEQIKAHVPQASFGKTDAFGVSKTTINPSYDPKIDKSKFEGVRSISLDILDNHLTSIWIGYDETFKVQTIPDFVKMISQSLKVPDNWSAWRSRGQQLRCNDFQLIVSTIANGPSLRILDIGAEDAIAARRQAKEELDSAAAEATATTEESAPEIVADKQQKVYYLSSCTPQISEANKIVFKSTEEAEKAGFKLARSCH